MPIQTEECITSWFPILHMFVIPFSISQLDSGHPPQTPTPGESGTPSLPVSNLAQDLEYPWAHCASPAASGGLL